MHALLGENGAGKSTLMRQLYGLYQPDEGEILIDGKPHVFHSPADAIRAGIGMIHQHFMLVPTLTVAENVALGLKSSREPLLDLDEVSARVRELSQAYGLKVDPPPTSGSSRSASSSASRSLKALYRGASLIILDEPTAVLTPQEVERPVRDAAAHGERRPRPGLHLPQAARGDGDQRPRDGAARRPHGRHATHRRASRATSWSRMMVGREVKPLAPQPLQAGAVRLKIEGLRAMGDRGTEALRGVDLEVRGGEIVGLAGVSGNGQRELAQCLAGLRKVTAGTIIIDGRT